MLIYLALLFVVTTIVFGLIKGENDTMTPMTMMEMVLHTNHETIYPSMFLPLAIIYIVMKVLCGYHK